MHPGKQPLDLISPAVVAQFPAVLGEMFASAPVGRDQLDHILFDERAIKPVRVVRFVADEPLRERVEEASGEHFFNKRALCRASALDRYGESHPSKRVCWGFRRETVIGDDSYNLGALPRCRRRVLLLALAKVAPTNASSRFSLPRRCKCRASSLSAALPERIHCWNRR